MASLAKIVNATFLTPARDVLHNVAIEIPKAVRVDVVPRLARLRAVVLAAVLCVVGAQYTVGHPDASIGFVQFGSLAGHSTVPAIARTCTVQPYRFAISAASFCAS